MSHDSLLTHSLFSFSLVSVPLLLRKAGKTAVWRAFPEATIKVWRPDAPLGLSLRETGNCLLYAKVQGWVYRLIYFLAGWESRCLRANINKKMVGVFKKWKAWEIFTCVFSVDSLVIVREQVHGAMETGDSVDRKCFTAETQRALRIFYHQRHSRKYFLRVLRVSAVF